MSRHAARDLGPRRRGSDRTSCLVATGPTPAPSLAGEIGIGAFLDLRVTADASAYSGHSAQVGETEFPEDVIPARRGMPWPVVTEPLADLIDGVDASGSVPGGGRCAPPDLS